MHSTLKIIIWMVLLAGWMTTVGQATMLVPLGQREITTKSALVVTGQVVNVTAAWDADHRIIFTRCTIHPKQVLKGPQVKDLVVSVPGGRVPDATGASELLVPGALYLKTGQQVVLFLDHGTRNDYLIMGLSQGAWEMVNPDSPSPILRRMAPLPQEVFQPAATRTQADVPFPNELTLESLTNSVGVIMQGE